MDLVVDDEVLTNLAPLFLRSYLVGLLALPSAGAPASIFQTPNMQRLTPAWAHLGICQTPLPGMLSPDLHTAAFFWSLRSQFKLSHPQRESFLTMPFQVDPSPHYHLITLHCNFNSFIVCYLLPPIKTENVCILFIARTLVPKITSVETQHIFEWMSEWMNQYQIDFFNTGLLRAFHVGIHVGTLHTEGIVCRVFQTWVFPGASSRKRFHYLWFWRHCLIYKWLYT